MPAAHLKEHIDNRILVNDNCKGPIEILIGAKVAVEKSLPVVTNSYLVV